MAKGAEKKKTNLMLNTAQNQAQGYTNQYMNQSAPERQTARTNATDLYGTMTGGYKDLAANKGITPELLAAIRGGAGGGGGGGGGGFMPDYSSGMLGQARASYNDFLNTGGVNIARTNEAMGHLGELAGSGGWSPEDRDKQNKLIQGLTEFGETGGINPQDIERMRGLGVFDEFAKTGGYTPQQIQDTRARATSQIPSVYAGAKAEADRMGRVTGQYNPAVAAQMARTAGYDTSKAALDAELGISDQVRQGRQWGTQGLTSAEQALQTLKTQNQLSGLTGAGGMRGNMLNSIAQNRTGAATGLGQLDIGSQGLIQQGKMFGTQGIEGMGENEAQAARANAAAGAAGAANNVANEKWLANFAVDNQLAGLGGLGNVYGSTPAELQYYDQMRQNTINSNIGNTSRIAGDRMTNNPQRDWASTIMGGVGSAVGAYTGMGFGNPASRGGSRYSYSGENIGQEIIMGFGGYRRAVGRNLFPSPSQPETEDSGFDFTGVNRNALNQFRPFNSSYYPQQETEDENVNYESDYTPSSTIRRYLDLIGSAPKREDYKQTKTNRILAALSGAAEGWRGGPVKGIQAAEGVKDLPYSKAREEYEDELKGAAEGVRSEQQEQQLKSLAGYRAKGLTEKGLKRLSDTAYNKARTDLGQEKEKNLNIRFGKDLEFKTDKQKATEAYLDRKLDVDERYKKGLISAKEAANEIAEILGEARNTAYSEYVGHYGRRTDAYEEDVELKRDETTAEPGMDPGVFDRADKQAREDVYKDSRYQKFFDPKTHELKPAPGEWTSLPGTKAAYQEALKLISEGTNKYVGLAKRSRVPKRPGAKPGNRPAPTGPPVEQRDDM